jgi:threonine/homoserine/homoserine lactone efflux protein
VNAFVFFTIAYLLAAGAPGADTMLIVSRTIVGGRASALQYALGIALAKTTMISLAFFGIGALLASNPQLFVILKTLGAGFLLFMAARLWLAKPTDASLTTTSKNSSRATSVLGGFLVGISNPQPLLFYSSIVPMVVAQGLNSFSDLVVLWLIVIIGFALITLFYMSLARVLRRWLDKAANRRVLNRAMAAVFVILALVIALR